MKDNDNNLSLNETAILMQEAARFGLDDPAMSRYGAQRIRNIQHGLERGSVSRYDLDELAKLVARARRIIIPMEWRIAFSAKPPPELICQGDIQPFTLLDGTPVGLSFLEMAEALRFTGRAGSSKTTGACAVLDATIGAGKSVIVVDSKGDGQFDYLCRKYPGRILKVRIGRSGHPFFNPWYWARAVREYFLQVFSRKDSRIVLDATEEGLRKQIALSGAVAFTSSQLLQMIARCVTPSGFPRIPPDFFRSMFSVLYDVEASPLHHQIACQRGWDLAAIVENGYSIIIDTSSIAATLHEEFLIVSFLAALRQEIMNSPTLRARIGTQVIFFVDECTNLSAASKAPGGLPPLVHLATLVRSSSICLFCGYHSMSIVHPVLNAAAIWLVAQISDGNDILTANRTFTLGNIPSKCLTELPKGVAMMRMGCRFTEPFLVCYPRIPDPIKMTDAEIDANNAPILAALPPILLEDYRKIRIPVTPTASAAAPHVMPPATSSPASAAPLATAPAAGLTNDYLAILRDIATNRFLNVGDRAGRLVLPSGATMTFSELKAALDDLKSQGFLGEAVVQMAPRAGAPCLMHFLVDKGHAAVGSLYKPARGEYHHDFGLHLIQHILAVKGIKADIEANQPGTSKQVDVGFRCPVSNLPIAIELPLSTFSSEPDQAERDLAAGWARVLVVCLKRDDLASAQKAFAASMPSPDSRIRLCLVSTLAALPPHAIYDSPDFVVKVNKTRKGTGI